MSSRFEIAVADLTNLNPFSIGERIRIIGEIHFGMDFHFCIGEFPEDLIWTVDGIMGDGDGLFLNAKGYGENPGSDNYGNGGICVRKKYFKNLEIVHYSAAAEKHGSF